MELIIESVKNALTIAMFVFTTMLVVDYLNVFTGGRIGGFVSGGRVKQYLMASFLGATPGCLGAFTNVTLYSRKMISFGALAGGMIATCGDTAYVMLSLFPGRALGLFLILFILGFMFSFVYDGIAPVFKLKPCDDCKNTGEHDHKSCKLFSLREALAEVKNISFERFLVIFLLAVFIYAMVSGTIGGDEPLWLNATFLVLLSVTLFLVSTVPDHYLQEHIWKHIIKKHVSRIFIVSSLVMIALEFGMRFCNFERALDSNMLWVLVLACLIGLIPDSSPHLVFTLMFSKGLVPFSVLLANSIVQDGHAMLPLLAYTVKDAVRIKTMNFLLGLIIGAILYLLGV